MCSKGHDNLSTHLIGNSLDYENGGAMVRGKHDFFADMGLSRNDHRKRCKSK